MDERKLKHLELIQGVINRLAGNSFLVKGWSVLLVSALLTLAARRQPDAGAGLLGIPFLPALIFWGLDGYFLWQERLYRALYNHVRVQPEDSNVIIRAGRTAKIGTLGSKRIWKMPSKRRFRYARTTKDAPQSATASQGSPKLARPKTGPMG